MTTFNDREEVMLNQLYAVLEKPVDTNFNCWAPADSDRSAENFAWS